MNKTYLNKGLTVAVIVLFIGVAVAPSINAKMNNEPIPDLDCRGSLNWDGKDLEPGDVLTGDFTVGNIGEPNSELDWQIVSCPFWGTWTFDPESGTDYTPEDGFVTVDVELILAVEINETIGGEIGIQNVEDENDICYINAVIQKKSDDDNLVELDVEFCGLGKKHTVKLTQEQAEEVELLFDDIEQRLSEVETREEAEEIFKDAIVELVKYGLLGRMKVKQTQRLITRNYTPLKNLNCKLTDDNSNYLCLIAGKTNDTGFISPLLQYRAYQSQSNPIPPPIYAILFCVFSPIIWLSYISYTSDTFGWLFAFGLNGMNFLQGNITGKIPFWYSSESPHAGVVGFTGIKLSTIENAWSGNIYYLGIALRMEVDVT